MALKDLPQDIRIARITEQKPHLQRMLAHVMADAISKAAAAQPDPKGRTH